MDSLAVPRELWRHPDPKSTNMYRLMQEVNQKHNLQLEVCGISSAELLLMANRHTGTYINTRLRSGLNSGTKHSTSSTSSTAVLMILLLTSPPESIPYLAGSMVCT